MTNLNYKNKVQKIKSDFKRKVYISKLFLENFLTFQKGEVVFYKSPSLNIIVGPNWSGKTTIFQAIKFALGSNERDERYKKWSDFIRHHQNKAMVEIHIQNGIELIQLRRTVIAGQSPFFSIKKEGDIFKKVQALEVQKLISDLNINPDNQFAFVGQGKIDNIKELKPNELCSFLEKGMGLKSLREEILQQKYDVLNLNSELNSLKTKKNTINIGLELLRPKLERLDVKKKLEEQKRIHEDELLWANKKKLKEDIKNLEEEILKIKAYIEEIQLKKVENEKELEIFQEKITNIEKNINEISEKLGEKKFQKQELEVRVQSWQKDKIKMKQELEALEEHITRRKKVLDNYTSQKNTLDKELNLIKLEESKVEKNIDDLMNELSVLKQKIKRNKNFLDEYNQVLLVKKAKLEEIQENEEYIEAYNDEIKQLFQSFEDIEHKLDKNKWFLKDPTANLLKKLDKEKTVIASKLYDINDEQRQLERIREKKFRKLKQMQGSLSHRRVMLPSNITILKDEIKKIPSLKSVKGPIIDFLKYDDSLSYAIESVLGENLLYSFVADNWETFNLLKILKKKFNAYCNIYLTKNLKVNPYPKISTKGVIGYLVDLIKFMNNDLDIKKVIYSKIKNCLVVQDYRAGQAVYATTNFSGKCVTLEGEQIVSYKYAFETPYTKRLKGFLSAGTQREQASVLETELQSLNEEISQLQVKASKLDNRHKEIYKKKEAFEDLLYTFKQKQRITTKKNNLYDKRTNLEELNTSIDEEIQVLDSKLKELESQKEPEFFKWNERFNQIPLELNEFYEEKKKWDKKLKENQEILKEIEENINQHSNKLSAIKTEHKIKKESFQKSDKEAFEIFREIGNIQDEIDKIKENISNLNLKKKEIQEEKSILDKRNISIKINLEQTNIKFNSTQQELKSKNNDLKRINVEIGEKPPKIRLIEEIKGDILKINKELLRYSDVDDSIIVERDQMIDSLKKIEKNQNDLKKDIKAAIKAENKMEDTYYNKFKIVLNNLKSKINQKFKNSDVKQYCTLDIVGDFENLGVEIKAATSKELVRECTALSGGQVSLISICLILSLQDIRTTPLCMFDEAAMFLDDKNTEVAYNLIKSTLEKRSIQIIVFLPQGKNPEFLSLADKVIGVARTGKSESSHVFEKPKIIKVDD